MNGRTIDPMVRQWRGDRQRHGTHMDGVVTLRRAGDLFLLALMGLAVIRGSQIWFGYPSAQDELVSGGSARNSIMLYILFACSLGYVVCFRLEVAERIRASNYLLWAFYCFALLSVVFSVRPVESAVSLIGVAALSFPALLFRWRFGEVGSARRMQRFFLALLVVNLLFSLALPGQAIMTGSLAGDWRGMFPHKNWFGHAMSFITILLLPHLDARSIRRPETWIMGMGAALAFGFAILSNSSTAILQILVGVATLVVIEIVRRLKTSLMRVLILTCAAILLAFLVMLAGSGALALIADSMGKDLTFSGRSFIWEALIPHILDYPMTGHGFGMLRNPDYIHRFLGNVPFQINSAHSTYIELALNLGLPGFLSWILFILARILTKIIWVPATNEERAISARNVAVMVMILIGSATEASQMLSTRFALLIMMLALPLNMPLPLARRIRPVPVAPNE